MKLWQAISKVRCFDPHIDRTDVIRSLVMLKTQITTPETLNTIYDEESVKVDK